MNILADSFPEPTTYEHGREISRTMIGDVIVGIQYSDWHCVKCGYKVDGKPMFKYCPNCGRVIKENTHECRTISFANTENQRRTKNDNR